MNIRGTDFIYYQTNVIDKAIAFYRDTLGLEMYGHFEEMKWAEFNAGNAFRHQRPFRLRPELEGPSGWCRGGVFRR